MNPKGWFQSVTWLPEPVNSQALIGFLSTHNNPSTHLSSTQPTPPKRMDIEPSLPCSPSGSPSSSRVPTQLVQNLHAETLRTHSCEQGWTRANAPQTCRPQVMAGLQQRPLHPTIPWLLFNNSFPFPQPRHEWGRMSGWKKWMEWDIKEMCEHRNGVNAWIHEWMNEQVRWPTTTLDENKHERRKNQPPNHTMDSFK